jgi:hypothetical protein
MIEEFDGKIRIEQVFPFLKENGIDLRPIQDVTSGNILVSFKGITFPITVPEVRPLGDFTFSEVVWTGSPRKDSNGDLLQTRRIFYPVLRNTNIHNILDGISTVREVLESSRWYIAGFWNFYAEALALAAAKAAAMRYITEPYAASIFSKEISAFLGKLPVVKSDLHLMSHSRVWEMGYPGKDFVGTSLELPSALLAEIKKVFHEKALELGCDITFTGKSHPGRRVMYAPTGVSPTAAQLWSWPNFGAQARAPREMLSALANAEEFGNTRHSTPRVTSEKNRVDFSRFVKHVNVAFLDLDEIVPVKDGRVFNADQVLGTGWSHIDGTFDTISEKQMVVPFAEGDTEESIREKYSYLGKLNVTLNVEPEGMFSALSWNISYEEREPSKMLWKAMTPEAVKGMVLPERLLLLEQRPGEDFLRPVYLVISASSVKKKDAGRMVLRILASRLPEPYQADTSTPRSEFGNVLSDIRSKLADIGDNGYSQIFRFRPSTPTKGSSALKEALLSLTSVRVLGFTEEDGHIVPIPEDQIGVLHGDLLPVVQSGEESPVETVVGEVPIMRMPEDEDFGDEVRTPKRGNGIRVDPFMVMGKPNLDWPIDESVKTRLNFAVQLYRALVKSNRTDDPQVEE